MLELFSLATVFGSSNQKNDRVIPGKILVKIKRNLTVLLYDGYYSIENEKSCCLFMADRSISMITLSDSSQNFTHVFGSEKGHIQSFILFFVETRNGNLKRRTLNLTRIKHFHNIPDIKVVILRNILARFLMRKYMTDVPPRSPLIDNRHCTIR